MFFDDVIKDRRSVRHFLDRRVEREKVEAVLRCAALSPSAKNRQPWYYSVLEGEAKNDFGRLLHERAEAEGEVMAVQTADIILDAAVLILVFSGRDCPSPSRTDILSAGGAMYSMCLKATDLGLGSLWIGDTDVIADDLERETDLGVLFGAIALGYPARHYPPRPRKTFDKISDFGDSIKAERVHDGIETLDLEGSHYAFCSYSHGNAGTVVADMIELQRHNVPIWYDKLLTVGEAWDEKALEWLNAEGCRAILLYISPESVASEPVMRELTAAIERKRLDPNFAIIPIHIGGRLLTDIIAESERLYGKRYGDVYLNCFGKENRVIFVTRDVYPSSCSHIESVIDKLAEVEIVTDGHVYDSFAYEIVGGKHAVITRYLGFSETVEPPSAISGYPLREIGDGAFAGNEYMYECILPDTVERVGAGAFRACLKLRSVRIPERTVELGVACFRDSTALPSINLPHGLSVLREALFRGCHSLVEIVVPEGVEELEEAVFRHCHSLTRAVLPSTLKRMTEGGFYDCPSLCELVIPEEVEGLEEQSFDTSPLLSPTVASGFVFEHGKARRV